MLIPHKKQTEVIQSNNRDSKGRILKGSIAWNKGKKTSTRTKEDKESYIKKWQKENPDKLREAGRKWYRNHKEIGKTASRTYQLKTKYGITPNEYNSLLENQNHVCAICKTNGNGKRLAVDHDHKTGRVRGLLCNRCNISLGAFNDDKELLLKSILYLEKNADTT